MDWQAAFNIAVMVGGGMFGWIVGRITKTLDQLDADIRAMPEKYVGKQDNQIAMAAMKADHQVALGEIKSSLRRIEDKLDEKQDKAR